MAVTQHGPAQTYMTAIPADGTWYVDERFKDERPGERHSLCNVVAWLIDEDGHGQPIIADEDMCITGTVEAICSGETKLVRLPKKRDREHYLLSGIPEEDQLQF